MDLASAREAKEFVRSAVLARFAGTRTIAALGVSARRLERPLALRSMAIGIAPGDRANDFRVAVRIQRMDPTGDTDIERIRQITSGEVDIRYIGRVHKLALQDRHRPVRVGCSVGHFAITAGTLGCFAESCTGIHRTMILSNNHVFADEGRARAGDTILQPGRLDGGHVRDDVIATLTNFSPLQSSRANLVDAAVAELVDDVEFRPTFIPGIGEFTGVSLDPVQPTNDVRKTGRTTGATEGRITAFELDNLVAGYDTGSFAFDGQIEVEGSGMDPFARGGDSGSMLVNSDGQAVGLLFAGSDTGACNRLGLTYVNPIGAVMSALNICLITTE